MCQGCTYCVQGALTGRLLEGWGEAWQKARGRQGLTCPPPPAFLRLEHSSCQARLSSVPKKLLQWFLLIRGILTFLRSGVWKPPRACPGREHLARGGGDRSSMHWISENVIINAPVYAYWFPHLLTLLAPHLFSYKLQNCSKYFQKHLELSSVLKWAYTFIIKIHFKILFKEQKLLTLPPKNNVFHDVWYLMDLTGPVSWLIQR